MYVVSLSFDSLPCGKITSRSPSSSDFKRKQVEAEMPREEEGVSLNKKISSLPEQCILHLHRRLLPGILSATALRYGAGAESRDAAAILHFLIKKEGDFKSQR